MKKHVTRTIACLVAIFILCTTLLAFTTELQAEETETKNNTAITEESEILYSYLKGKKAGAMTGTPQDGWIREHVKDGSMSYFASLPDELLALTEGKIDYFIIPTVNFNLVKDNYPDTCQTSVVATEQGVSFLMNKTEEGEELQTEINAYIHQLSNSGELERLQQHWLFSDDEKEPVDIPTTGEKGTLRLATTSSLVPYTYKIEDQFAGFEIDILAGFCRENGYALQIDDMDFAGILTGVTSGKYDLGCGGVSATPERRKSVYFCDYTYVQSFQVVMRTEDVPAGVGISYQSDQTLETGFMDRLYRNFVAENRWQLLLSGAVTTIGITLLASFFGTILGYLICRMRIAKKKALSAFARGYIYLFSGLPQVLLLMVFYFIIFASSDLPGFIVASIAFSFNFSATVASLLKNGIDNVDGGQMEAALTLGYNERNAFHKIVLPQAIRNSIDVYRGQVISLLKATSVVGYIAVQDMTKVADIIRSRTFDAFIPLIFAGFMYFVLAHFLITLLDYLSRRLLPVDKDPRQKAVLKGVNLK